MKQPWLTTARLVLRQFAPSDLEALAALDADPAVMKYLNGGRPVAFEEVRDRILPLFLDWHAREADRGFWVIETRLAGEFLGWFHFRPPHEAEVRGVEVGYRLRRAAWGQGYATEATRAVVTKAFEELGVERVVAKTLAVNLASRRVMEKAGLRFVESFTETRIDPPQEAVWYALERDSR